MCGIAGHAGPGPVRVREMTSRLAHRGPDDEGFYDSGDVHFGMRRLAIVDLATGQQPMLSADESVAVVFNGEIYNYVELRRELAEAGYPLERSCSDTEVVVALYRTEGIRCLDRLIGMFAVAIHDRRRGEVYLVRDRLGKKPIYYRHDAREGSIEFASELGVFDLPNRAGHLDHDSLAWYFSQKTTRNDASIDLRVRKVPPGCYLRFASGACEVVRYYSIPVPEVKESDADAAESRVERLITESVRLRMRADVEVGAYLSGGIDSSLIVALAAAETDKPLKTYCLVYEDEINEKSSDRRWSRAIAERFGTIHTEVLLTPSLLAEELPSIVRHYAQPNSAVISNWFISRVMGRELKVALSGDGADELFGSYFLHRVSSAADRFRRSRDTRVLDGLRADEREFVERFADLPFAQWVDRFAVFPDAELAKLLEPNVYRAGRILQLLEERERELGASDPLDRMLEFDCRNLLVDQVLNYSDTLSMAHSLEVRTPYLDHRRVAEVFALDESLKIRNGETKWLLKRIARRYLPAELVDRKKEGFVEPAVYWIGNELRDFCRSWILAPRFNRLGLLDSGYVRHLLDRFDRERDFGDGKRVWSLLIYAIWESGVDS